MDKYKFDAVFPIICSDLTKKIAEELTLDGKEAIQMLYSSTLYEKLEQEETKVWQYSTTLLFELFLEERNTGHITFPQI